MLFRWTHSLIVLLLAQSLTIAAEPNASRSWIPFFVGQWTREGVLEIDGEAVEYRSKWTCSAAAGGHACVTHGSGTDGDSWVNIDGWDGQRNGLHEYGMTSEGDNWTVLFKSVDANKLEGDAAGALSDGRTGNGTASITRTGENSYVSEFKITLNDGSVFRSSEKNVRVKPPKRAESIKLSVARVELKSLHNAVTMYQIRTGGMPPTLQTLVDGPEDEQRKSKWTTPLLSEVPTDPWDNDYVFVVGDQRYELRSAGPDQKLNTTDDLIQVGRSK